MKLSLFVFAVVWAVGCGDDPDETRGSDVAFDAADSADAVSEVDETRPETAIDSAQTQAPDFGAISYAEISLSPAADFDPTWESLGDAVVTTLVETLRPRFGRVPHLDEAGALKVPAEAVGQLSPQPGEPHLLRDQLAITPSTFTPGALPSGSRSMLYMFVLADPQLVDQDSPAQVAKNASTQLAGISLPAYTPQGELGPHLNDALVRTADRFQDARPFDVVVIAGDHIENTQENEPLALHAVLNGGPVSSDSGARDDVEPGPDNDAYDPFVAGGFRAGTPWISSIGNHDVNIEGNFPPGLVAELNQNPDLRAQLDSISIPLGAIFPYEPTADEHPALFPHAQRSAFRVDPERFHPKMMTTRDELSALTPGPTPPDPTRAPMGVCGFITKTFEAAGDPPGHGFSQANVQRCTGFYTFDPVPGVPIRIVSLDLGPHEGGSNGILAPPYADGAVLEAQRGDPDVDQLAFLKAALDDAADDGVAVIVLSHQASDAIVQQSQLQDLAFILGTLPDIVDLIDRWSPVPPESTTVAEFRKILVDSPNVIAHVAGHNHRHRVRAICPDGTTRAAGEARCAEGPNGQTGYWELTTSAGIDFPHQGRFFEVVHVGGREAALYLTTLDARIPAGSFTERGRFISVTREELGSGTFGGAGEVGDRNLLLPFVIPDSVATRWAGLGEGRIESETSLHESYAPLPQLPVWP